MDRIESLPPPIPGMTQEQVEQYLNEVSIWVKKLEDRLVDFDEERYSYNTYTVSVTPSVVAAFSGSHEVVSVSGITSGVPVTLVSAPVQANPDVQCTGVVASADDELTFVFVNVSSSGATPDSGDYVVQQMNSIS